MGPPDGASPFAALGLAARADLTDDEVRSAWRRVAAATHPDRADGGDPSRFAVAAAAYTMLRTRSGRGEALADLASQSPGSRWPRAARARAPDTSPPRAGPGSPATPPDAALPEPPPQPGPAPPVTTPPAAPLPGAAPHPGRPGWVRWLSRVRLLSRIRRGRPARLALRILIAAALGAVAVVVDGLQPATPALITGALTWLLLTARHDLAP